MPGAPGAVFGARLPAEMPAAPAWRSAWIGHAPFAFWIVAVLRPRMLVELGVHHGFSYCCFCEEVRRAGLPTRCFGVDTWQGEAHAGHYGAEVLAALRAHHDPLYVGFSELLPMTFDAAAARFAPGSIDLLHIDGFHTEAAVRHDFETWRPLLSPNAVVLFHDIDERRDDFGVWKLWEQVSAGRPHFALHHQHGLGVLGMGSDYPPPLAALFAATGEEAQAIRAGFEALGGHVAARHAQQRRLEEAVVPKGLAKGVVRVARRLRAGLR